MDSAGPSPHGLLPPPPPGRRLRRPARRSTAGSPGSPSARAHRSPRTSRSSDHPGHRARRRPAALSTTVTERAERQSATTPGPAPTSSTPTPTCAPPSTCSSKPPNTTMRLNSDRADASGLPRVPGTPRECPGHRPAWCFRGSAGVPRCQRFPCASAAAPLPAPASGVDEVGVVAELHPGQRWRTL